VAHDEHEARVRLLVLLLRRKVPNSLLHILRYTTRKSA
jgi:hypothetical protein